LFLESGSPSKFILHDKGTPCTIQWLEMHKAREALGIMSRPNCSMEVQVEAMWGEAAKWVDGIWTKRINATNA